MAELPNVIVREAGPLIRFESGETYLLARIVGRDMLLLRACSAPAMTIGHPLYSRAAECAQRRNLHLAHQ